LANVFARHHEEPVINPGFTAAFQRIIFEVVNSAPGTIPAGRSAEDRDA
jgi:hypothetical protein